LADKQPPREFNPHPGDPWHPDWSLDDEVASDEVTTDDEPWWRRALGRKGSSGEPAAVPEAYAALHEADTQEPAVDESQLVTDAIAAAESELAAELEPVVEVVITDQQEPPDEVVPTDDEPGLDLVPTPNEWSDILMAAQAEPPTLIESTPVEDSTSRQLVPAPLLMAEEPAATDAFEDSVVVDLSAVEAMDDEPELYVEQAEAATRRAAESEDRLLADSELELAQSVAHEEARMWIAVGLARAEADALGAAADRVANRNAEHRAALDAWAAEALAIEEARLSMDESRRRTEAEVQTALEQGFGTAEQEAGDTEAEPLDAAAVNARFADIAADIAERTAAESGRLVRREELRLRTSLLVLDAEQPWEAEGWSRPGASFDPRGAGSSSGGSHVNPIRSNPRGPSAQLLVRPQDPIATGSVPVMPESADRRRWPWSRQSDPATAPDGMQASLRSVVVIEERSVSDREHELGEDGQDPLPLDDAASSAESPNGAGLDDDLAAWSDLDWDPDASPAGEDPLHRGATIVFGAPDSAHSADSADEPDWEHFTAEEYVQTATHEYADLAAAVAAAEAEAPEQAAIAADMPGLESSLVGLEDVVAAEGMETATTAPVRSDLAIRVVTALALVILFFASLTFHWSIAILVLVVMAVAAFELTTTLLNNDHHPVGLFVYLGTIGALLGTWAYGPVAVPVAVAATLLVTVLFFGLVTGRQEPLVAMGLTVLVVLWVGVFASFAMDIIEAEEFRWLVGSFVIIVAAMDIAQYFVGRRFGKRKLAPVVSPKKTVAGLVGGVVAAVGIGYAFSFFAPYDAVTGVVLGGAIALSGPTGDLAVSVFKRALGVKDMGTILPGHGGVLDRIDAILFSLPAAWIVYSWAGLLV